MKKISILLLALVTLGIMGCKRTQVSNDVAIVNGGRLSFYDATTQQLTPLEAETDSVINLLFADSDHLYYSVVHNNQVLLKMVDVSASKPAPKQCADWTMTVDEAIDFMYNQAWDMNLDAACENIVMYRMNHEDFLATPVTYNLKSGKVSDAVDDTFYTLYSESNVNRSHFLVKNHLFYYVSPEKTTCLNDKIDFSQVFPDEEERDELDFVPLTLSPDGKSLVYSAVLYWGEGWGHYCLANLDGTAQALLVDSDIWTHRPEWLANGSLVYVARNDEESDDDFGLGEKGSIQLIDMKDKTTMVISDGNLFAVRPANAPKGCLVEQGGLEGCDVAVFDNGQVTFYNTQDEVFVPYVVETDSVINGVFVDDYSFYYTVKLGDKLFLKSIVLSDYEPEPNLVADWELRYDQCVSETYGKASPLLWFPEFERIGINYDFNWDFYNFAEVKFYDFSTGHLLNGWNEEEDVETDVLDGEFLQFEEDLEHFSAIEGNYYYTSREGMACLSDKINFKDYCYDPEYYSEPEYQFYSIDPTRRFAAYVAYIEWGDLGHGPLCIVSLDGKQQIALKDTDAADLSWGWLSDGSLLYVGVEPRPADDPAYDAEYNNTKPCVRILHTDGTDEVFSQSADFVVRKF